MENEQTSPEKGCTNCGGKECGAHCEKWTRKNWKKHHGGCKGGGIWFAGWLFTIGFLKLTFWKGVLALVVWPYFLGSFFAR
jgi:hypothetical protein